MFQTEIENLKEFVNQKNASGAKELLSDLSKNLCKFELSNADADVLICNIFDEQLGTIPFLSSTILERKLFQEANVLVFTIWIQLLKHYGNSSDKFEKHVNAIVHICINYIRQGDNISAKERERAVQVLQEVIQHKLFDENLNIDITAEILKMFNIKKRHTTLTLQAFRLFGLIAKYYKHLIAEYANNIRNIFLKTIEDTALNNETVQSGAVSGALEGLNHLISSFPFLEADFDWHNRIYICVRKLSDYNSNMSHKATCRASLEFFVTHSFLFVDNIYSDFEFWIKILYKWKMSPVMEDKKKGIQSINSLHISISAALKGKDLDDKAQAILKCLILQFTEVLENPVIKSDDIRIVIKGFGILARSFSQFSSEDYSKLLTLINQKTELITITEDKEFKDNLEHFPDYIQALSQILLDGKEQKYVQILEKNILSIIVRVFKDFHFLASYHTPMAVNSICCGFYNLMSTDSYIADEIIGEAILQGIIWTCSHKPLFEADDNWQHEEDWKENLTYKKYLPLWFGILKKCFISSSITSYNSYVSFDKALVSQKIFDCMMSSLFLILEKLDLRTKQRLFQKENGEDEEFHFCDPNIDLCPVKSRDFHIFFNLVDFYKDIFKSNFQREYFYKWMEEYCIRMITCYNKNPLISGFLKLLVCALDIGDAFICKESSYFQSELHIFFENVLDKSQILHGEIQQSCVELICKYPVSFYKKYINDLVKVFKTAFDLGKSNITLAKLAVNTVIKLYTFYEKTNTDIKYFCENVFPFLNIFLEAKFEESNILSRKRLKKENIKQVIDSDIFIIQKTVIDFLGTLDQDTAALIISKPYRSLTKWNLNQIVEIGLKLPDIEPSFFLDSLLPKMCQLATTSTDRQTKISSCEFVHAYIIYMVGRRCLSGLEWKHICSTMLILGSDNDTTINEMFTPLIYQIMHYMSKQDNIILDGVGVLLNCLTEGISNNNNELRVLSAICLREFVEWSIKQSSTAQLESSPASIKKILDILKVNSVDCNKWKRNGAALAFNNLYRIFREEESICNKYFLELLYIFCLNFKLTEEFENYTFMFQTNFGLDQVSKSLDHIVRVFRERSYIFNKKSSDRIVPNGFGDGCLIDIVRFLFKECSHKLISYRQKCMEMIEILADKISGVSSISAFIAKFVSIPDLLNLCENIIHENPNIAIEKGFSKVHDWLQHLLASLDCFCWLLQDSRLSESNILFDGNRGFKIFEAVTYFLKNFCSTNFLEGKEITTNEEIKVKDVRCVVIIRTFDFLASVIQQNCGEYIPSNFWKVNSKELEDLIEHIILEPESIDYHFRFNDILSQLHPKIKHFWAQFSFFLKENIFYKALVNRILKRISDKLINCSENMKSLIPSLRITKHHKHDILAMAFGLKCFKNNFQESSTRSLILKSSMFEILEQLFQGIAMNDKNCVYTISPEAKSYGNCLIDLCFLISDAIEINPEFYDYICKLILNDQLLTFTQFNTQTTHGQHFFITFQSSLCATFDKIFFRAYLPKFFENYSSANLRVLMKLLITISEFLYKFKRNDSDTLITFVDICISYIPMLLKSTDILDYKFLQLLQQLSMIYQEELHTFGSKIPDLEPWIITQLKLPKTLEQKCKVLTILPLVIGSSNYDNLRITNALCQLQNQHLPLSSKEFSDSILKETSLKHAYKSILNVLVTSKSYIILKFIMTLTSTDKEHLLEYLIRDELINFMKILNDTEQLNVLIELFNFLVGESFDPEIRLNILVRFMFTLFQNASETVAYNFILENMAKIVEMMTSSLGNETSGWAVNHALVNRNISYSLMEIYYAKVPEARDFNNGNAIFKEGFGTAPHAKKMTGALCKLCYEARQINFSSNDVITMELFRLYQCAAYKCMCSLVCNTQSQIEFYCKFLFDDGKVRLWRRFFNFNKQYIFENQTLKNIPKIKENIVTIRKVNNNIATSLPLKSSRSLQVQHILESSLSMDVSKIDMNFCFIRNGIDVTKWNEQSFKNNMSVALENHELNKHEIMPVVCGVLKHMAELKIIQPTKEMNKSRKIGWVQLFVDSISNAESPRFVRVFLVQVIDNCRSIFETFAYMLFKPIAQVIVDECAGNKLNFFITDIISLLLSWSVKDLYTPTTSEDISLASDLLKFVLKNVGNDDQQIFEFNIELIKSMITIWRNIIHIPSRLLIDMYCNSEDFNSKISKYCLNIFGIILSNELIPWTDTLLNDYLNCLLKNALENEDPSIFKTAAHVLGMSLSVLEKNNETGKVDHIEEKLKVTLKLWNNNKDDKYKNQFRDILYGFSRSYPKILRHFRTIFQSKIPSSTCIGKIKTIYMEMFLISLDFYNEEDLFADITSIQLRKLLKSIDYQLLALHILNKSLSKLKRHNIDTFNKDIEYFCITSKHIECRRLAYEFYIFIVTNYTENTLDCQSILLKGLGDPDTNIKNRILEFWNNQLDLYNTTSQKLEGLFRLGADTNCGSNYFSFCINIILSSALKHDDAVKNILTVPVYDNENKLIEYSVNTNCKSRTLKSTLPYFARDVSLKHTSRPNKPEFQQIKDSKNVSQHFFAPTQDVGFLSKANQNFSMQNQTSMLFNVPIHILDKRSSISRISTIPVNDMFNKDSSLHYLRSRFINSNDNTLQLIDYKKRTKFERTKKINQRTFNEIIVFRRYRQGEFPDFNINVLSFLLPLQAITTQNSEVAKDFFVILTLAITSKLQSPFSFYENIGSYTQNPREKIANLTFFSSFLEIGLQAPRQLFISPATVSHIAKYCNKPTIGALYLEQVLLHEEFVDVSSCKSSPATITEKNKYWIHLSDIYQYLKENDVLSAIFSEKVMVDHRLTEAIELKSQGFYEKAEYNLNKVVERSIAIEQYYAFNALFDIYLELGNWNELWKQVTGQLGNNLDNIWEDDYHLNVYLPKLIQSDLLKTLRDKQIHSSMFSKIESWMTNKEKNEHLTKNFYEEIMVFNIIESNFAKARKCYEEYLKRFLMDWSSKSTLCQNMKLDLLLNAQKASEIDYLASILQSGKSDSNTVQTLVRQFKNLNINPSKSIIHWHSLVAFRCFCIELIILKFGDIFEDKSSLLEDLLKTKQVICKKVFNEAIRQQNIGLASMHLKLMRPSEQERKMESLPSYLVEYKMDSIRFNILSNKVKSNQHYFDALNQGLNNINELATMLDTNSTFSSQTSFNILFLKANIVKNIFYYIQNHQITKLNESILKQITQGNLSKNLTDQFYEECIHNMQTLSNYTIDINKINNTKEGIDLIASSFYDLAVFCYAGLSNSKLSQPDDIEKIIISSISQSMYYESKEARRLFPCLLELPSIKNGNNIEQEDLFKENVSNIPEWMFLNWIPQILSYMNISRPNHLDDIISRIAFSYPNAIKHSFDLWYANLKYEKRNNVKDIKAQLHNDVTNKFVECFKYLCVPEILLKTYLKRMYRYKIIDNQITQEEYTFELENLLKTVYTADDNLQGLSYRRIHVFKEKLENLLTMNILKDRDNIRKILDNIEILNEESLRNLTSQILLKNISPWLSNFQWSSWDYNLELPGQYEGFGTNKPVIPERVKVIKFENNIKVFPSLRRPIQLTIHCSNGRKYDFLIKFGEDLRQDQRVQQILNIMSEKLNENRKCSDHNLVVRTYKVIPILSDCGMLSFVKDSISLNDFLLNTSEKMKPNSTLSFYESLMAYKQFISKYMTNSKTDSSFVIYGEAVKNYDVDAIRSNFRNLEANMIKITENFQDKSIFKNGFLQLASSPESYFELRNNFIYSLSTMNITNWILGIGDRHLSNILINLKDGFLTGIDFGMIFGSATLDLPVPELVPFRLTPQFTYILEPFGTSGLLSKSMIRVLEVLKHSKHILLACVNVFVRDPIVDWFNSTELRLYDKDILDGRNYSKQQLRVDSVRYKLEGYNPKYLTIRDLENGNIMKNEDYLRAYIKLVKGFFNNRTNLPDACLSVEDQIKCLIDQATDPVLLGVAYEGYRAWQ
ncbi:PRKDC family protein [Megaselia abdita]